MSDLTKWLPLWERCPELRPEGLIRESYGWDMEGGVSGRWGLVSESTAAALIRDRAVWWLADQAGVVLYYVSEENQDGERSLVQLDSPDCERGDPLEDPSLHDDPTEALRLACCKVLGMEP